MPIESIAFPHAKCCEVIETVDLTLSEVEHKGTGKPHLRIRNEVYIGRACVMTVHQLRQHIIAVPFVPFQLRTGDGRLIPVVNRDFVLINPSKHMCSSSNPMVRTKC